MGELVLAMSIMAVVPLALGVIGRIVGSSGRTTESDPQPRADRIGPAGRAVCETCGCRRQFLARPSRPELAAAHDASRVRGVS
jgi:hypothetical protein